MPLGSRFSVRTSALMSSMVPSSQRPRANKHLAGLGDRDAARAAFEQFAAEFVLEFLDVAAERRLRDIERARCGCEAAAFGHRDEIAKLPQIHVWASISIRDSNHIKHILVRYKNQRTLPANDKTRERRAWASQPTQRARRQCSLPAAARSGLAMSLLLDRFGIDCVVVEKSPTTTDHPKSRGCWVRTMEIFRQWGIEKAIRDRGLQENSDMFVFLDSIAGHEYGRTRPEPNVGHTPAWKSLVAQDAVEEEILRVVEKSKHATVLFSTECESFEETNSGVRVKTRCEKTGEVTEWSATYLIAADGAGSRTRRSAGIEMVGPSTLAVMSNEYWRADLSCSADRARGRRLHDRPGQARPAARRHPQHQRPRPLADGDPNRPDQGRSRAAVDRPGIHRDRARPCRHSGPRCHAAEPLDLARQHAGRRDVPERPGVPGRRLRASLSADRWLRPELRAFRTRTTSPGSSPSC